MSNRNVRVNELLKREISDILHTRFQKEAVGVTITRVDVSPDHSVARVYFSALEIGLAGSARTRAQGWLNRISGKVRHELGRRIVLKRIPLLKFGYDEALAEEARIHQLLDELEESEGRKEP